IKTQCLGYPCSVSRICSITVADMTELDELGCVSHGSGGIAKQDLLLFGRHQSEQFTGLLKVVAIIFMKRPMFGVAGNAQRRLGVFGLGMPLAKAVWLVVRQAAVVAVYATHAVTVVAVDRAACPIGRDLVMVGSQAIALGVGIVDQPVLQHAIRAG